MVECGSRFAQAYDFVELAFIIAPLSTFLAAALDVLEKHAFSAKQGSQGALWLVGKAAWVPRTAQIGVESGFS